MKRSTRVLFMVGCCVATPLALVAQQPDSFVQQDDSTAPTNPYVANGRVVTATGQAAPGVQVLLEISDMRIRRPIASDQTRTDSRGEFSFDLSAYDIPTLGLEFMVDSPRYQPRIKIIEVPQGELPVEVELPVEPGTLARGTVRSADGKPLEGVRVSFPGGRPRQSDENGEWEAWGLPTGNVTVQLRAPGYAPALVDVRTQEPGIVEDLNMVLESARQLSGRVVNRRGEGIDGAMVGLKADTGQRLGSVRTRDGGKFTFTSVPDAQHAFEIAAQAPPPFLFTVERRTIAPDSTDPVDVILDEGLYMTGRVTTTDGHALASARIVINDPDRGAPLGETVSDADGNWRLGAFEPKAAVQVVVLPGSSDATWGIGDLVVAPAAPGSPAMDGEVELWNRPFSSRFKVSVKDGRVVMTRIDDGAGGMGGEVLYDAPWDGQAERIEGTVAVPTEGRTGTFTMTRRYQAIGAQGPNALAGEWEIREELTAATTLASPALMNVTLPRLPVDVRSDSVVPPATTIAGRVVREDGTPFIDGKVYLTDWNRTRVLQLTTSIKPDGTFTMSGVPVDGTFLLSAFENDGEHRTGMKIARGGLADVILTEGDPPPDPMDE